MVETFSKSIKDSVLASTPFIEVTVIDKNGDSNQVKGYRRPANLTSYVPDQEMQAFDTDRLYALVGKEKTFVLVQYFQFDKVIKPAVWFLRR